MSTARLCSVLGYTISKVWRIVKIGRILRYQFVFLTWELGVTADGHIVQVDEDGAKTILASSVAVRSAVRVLLVTWKTSINVQRHTENTVIR